MKKPVVFICILAVLSFVTGAWAATSYSGSEGNKTSETQTNGAYTMIDVGGMGATGNAWMGIVGSTGALARSQGVHMDWSVNDTANPGNWTYTYTFTENSNVNNKQVVSFYLSFGGSYTDIVSQTLTGYTTKNATGTGTNLGLTSALGDYAGLPGGTFTGLQWAFSTPSPLYYSFSLTLVTKDSPVWGDYVAVGPVAGGDLQTMKAWNLGIGNDSPDPIGPASYAGYNWVMTPGAAPVPLPAAAWLLGSGLVGLGLIRKKRPA